MRRVLPAIVLFTACRVPSGDVGFPEPVITLESPTYGSFHGDGPVEVRGRVSPAPAIVGGIAVRVEGELVDVAQDGSFTTAVPFDRRFRVVDVEAAIGSSHTRTRVPVFDGHDPLLTWPGGMTARITPEALRALGGRLGGMIDAMGWDEQIANALPTIDTDAFDLVPQGVTHAPTQVVLAPDMTGIHVGLAIVDVSLDYVATVDLLGTPFSAPLSIGFEEIVVTALAQPVIDADGMLILRIGDPQVQIGEPQVEVFGSDVELIEFIVGLGVDLLVEPLADTLGDLLLSQLQDIPLGGPFAFQTELMGMPIDIRLSEVYTDTQGIGAGIGMGIGEDAPTEGFDIPAPYAPGEPVHLALGVHEGVFQMALDSLGVLDMLSQDLQLPGAFGEVIGAGIRTLPGGETAPYGDGWCLALNPNPQGQSEPAQVVRVSTDGIDPLAVMYLPDLGVNVGIVSDGFCAPWLNASVSAEIGLVVSGTTVSVDAKFVDGAVLSYAATSPWEEEAVITGLNGFLTGALSLLGGQLSFDLADLLGGLALDPSQDPFGITEGLSPALVDARPLIGLDGQPVEGMAQVDLRLWE